MDLDLFDFDLPKDRIAQHPVSPRDAARLLVVDGRLSDKAVRDLPDLLAPGDLLVGNDTKVIAARLTGEVDGPVGPRKVEVTLHLREDDATWRAFAKPAKRLAEGDRLRFRNGLSADVTAKGEAGEVSLRFDRSGLELMVAISKAGQMPLPPYIKRPAGGAQRDLEDYQTMFASAEGAVAAPTAGLHFTPDLLQRLTTRDIDLITVTLHVGAGTFLPVRTQRADEHKMHGERGIITPEAAERINAARAAGGRIVAIGTTALRLLESAAAEDGKVRSFSDVTDLFILPGYRFKVVDQLITNFHLPRSTLFMLVSAFSGLGRMQDAYVHAVRKGYRFYSYGDACLLDRAVPEATPHE